MDELNKEDLNKPEKEDVKVVVRATGTSFPAFTSESRAIYKCLGGKFNSDINAWIINLTDPVYPFTEKDMDFLKYLIKIAPRVYKNSIDVEVYQGKKRIRQLSKEIKAEETGFVKREK